MYKISVLNCTFKNLRTRWHVIVLNVFDNCYHFFHAIFTEYMYSLTVAARLGISDSLVLGDMEMLNATRYVHVR